MNTHRGLNATRADDWRAHFWLCRRHDPRAPTADLLVWRLGDEDEAGLLLADALTLPNRIPVLAQGFRFDGIDLRAEIRPVEAPAIVVATDRQTATEALLAFQTEPADPDSAAPFRIALVTTPAERLFALRLDRIAGGDGIAAAVVRALAGDPWQSQTANAPVMLGDCGSGWMARAGSAPAGQIARASLPPRSDPVQDATAMLSEVLCQLGYPSGPAAAVFDGCTIPVRAAAALPGLPAVAVGRLAPCRPPQAAPGARRLLLPLPAGQRGPELILALAEKDGAFDATLATAAHLAPGLAELLLDRLVSRWGDGASPSRSAAPAQTISADGGAARESAGGDAQALILSAFREALSAPAMTADEDFFDRGGHSLTATRIIGRLASDHGLHLRFDDVFSHPTARQLASRAEWRAAAPSIAAIPVSDRDGGRTDAAVRGPSAAPLSLAQASLWKVYAALGKGNIFNIPFGLRFLDPVDEDAFGAAFRDVLVRHPVLRSLFVEDAAGGVTQRPVATEDLDRIDWFRNAADHDASRTDEAVHVFDLERELPLRLRFLREDGAQVLSMVVHHVVLDEWSVDLVMNDLARAYAARSAGRAPEWPDAPPPFADFAAAQSAHGAAAAHLSYWTDRLRGAPAKRPFTAGGAAAAGPPAIDGGWCEIAVPQEVARGLHQMARACDASLFNIVYAAIASALRVVSGQDDLVIGTSAAGRGDPHFFDTVGYFTTVVAHRLRLGGDLTPALLVARVRDMINESLPHDSIPIDLVEEALGHAGPDHIFELFIQIHAGNRLNGTLTGAGDAPIRYRQIDPEKSESLLGLQFEVMEDMIDGQRMLRVMMSYRTDSYGREDVERLVEAVQAMMARFSDQTTMTQPIPPLA